MSTPKYKVGDKVVIVSKRVDGMNPVGLMDGFLGKIVTIRNIWYGGNFNYNIKEDYGVWSWSDDMIDHEATVKLNNKEEKTMENKTAKLIIDGKEFEVTLPDNMIAELTKPKKVTGFERADYDEFYYYVDGYGEVLRYTDHHASAFEEYNAANYYTNETLAEWCSRADTLNRKMRRWAAEHNVEPVERGKNTKVYYIAYNLFLQEVRVNEVCSLVENSTAYFNIEEIAEAAIEEFGDEIKWLAENRPEWF